MGYYIQARCNIGKADIICEEHGAIKIPQPKSFKDVSEKDGLICVVSNGPFEAAGFCFDEREFREFSDPKDDRPKTWLLMERAKAEQLSGYKERKK
jgi:hypothetical protein